MNFITQNNILCCSPTNEVQMKRYRNNDILSSLSSSIQMNASKDANANLDSTPVARPKTLEINAKEVSTEQANELNCLKGRRGIGAANRIVTSKSDLTDYHKKEQPKQVLKSMSDGSAQTQEIRKTPKLTLFNKDYSTIKNQCEIEDDEDENSVSFVKPKTKTSKLFSLNRNRKPSKLSMILSSLRGDESKDEVDTVKAKITETVTSESEEKKVSEPASLITTTNVTFSTATTTSILNTPLSTVNTVVSEIPKAIESNAEVKCAIEINNTQSTVVSAEVSKPETLKPSTTSSSTEATQTTVSNTPLQTVASPNENSMPTTTSSSSQSIARVGGFSFGQNTVPQAKPITTDIKTTDLTQVSTAPSLTISKPTFSFGANPSANVTSTANTLPTFEFGDSKSKLNNTTKSFESNIVTANAPGSLFAIKNPSQVTTATTLQATTLAPLQGITANPLQGTSLLPSTTGSSSQINFANNSPLFSFEKNTKPSTASNSFSPSTMTTTTAANVSPANSSFVFGKVNSPSINTMPTQQQPTFQSSNTFNTTVANVTVANTKSTTNAFTFNAPKNSLNSGN